MSNCGYVLKRTHGLLYAHEIVQWKREGSGIPLLSIHTRWKQLSDIPRGVLVKPIDYEQEISLIRKRLNDVSEEQKCMMLKIILERGNPAFTQICNPLLKIILSGLGQVQQKRKY